MSLEKTVADDPQTCGKGLAANATLPAKLAELLSAQAEVLERHMKALDSTQADAQQELEAYAALVSAFRASSSQLSAIADQMASYRDLPMPSHDPRIMADPHGQMEAYAKFLAIKRELIALLGSNA
jgi:hypothetical protein